MNDSHDREMYDLGFRNGMNGVRALVTMTRRFLNDQHDIPGELDATEKKFYRGGGHTALEILEAIIKAELEKRVESYDSRGTDNEV
jgi:hypothetical protein